MPTPTSPPRFFRTPAAFRAWLDRHHASKAELWIGFYKKSSGRGGMVYPQALDEALCTGWIDGIVKSVDDESYMQRFSPRKAKSSWSVVNVRRFGELEAEGRVAPAGRAAFERGTVERRASYELAPAEFSAAQRRELRANAEAWSYFERQPPGYKRTIKHWVTSAKREETRAKRLARLIAHSACGERVPPLG